MKRILWILLLALALLPAARSAYAIDDYTLGRFYAAAGSAAGPGDAYYLYQREHLSRHTAGCRGLRSKAVRSGETGLRHVFPGWRRRAERADCLRQIR